MIYAIGNIGRYVVCDDLRFGMPMSLFRLRRAGVEAHFNLHVPESQHEIGGCAISAFVVVIDLESRPAASLLVDVQQRGIYDRGVWGLFVTVGMLSDPGAWDSQLARPISTAGSGSSSFDNLFQ